MSIRNEVGWGRRLGSGRPARNTFGNAPRGHLPPKGEIGMTQRIYRGSRLCRDALPAASFLFGCLALSNSAIAAEPDKDALIREALSAGPPAIASTAMVQTMDGKVLKE